MTFNFAIPFVHVASLTAVLAVIGYLIYRRYKAESDASKKYRAELEARIAERTHEVSAANERLQQEITSYKEMEARLIEQQRKVGAAEEREQLARSLQDDFGQVIGYVSVQAQAAITLLNKNEIEAARENLELLAQAAQGAHSELRSYILGLRGAEGHHHNLFESMRAYLEAFSRAWEIETVFSIPQETMPILPQTVEDQILQVVQEALVNIRKHAEAKRVEVLLTVLPRELLLVISDNGRGFEPSKAPGVEQKRFGLSIMRERTEQVGGQLEVRSVVGQGAQIIAHIPRIFPAGKKEPPKELAGTRILLVDDQPLFLEGMRNLLTARGLTVIGQARDGYEAIEQVRSLHPDIVLMDVQMPNCDGIEATRQIKKDFPEVKVALLTGIEDDESFVEAVKLGAAGYFQKSMNINDIIAMLVGSTRHEIFIPQKVISRLLTEIPPEPKDAAVESELTLRQWEILQLVAKGLTYKEVGRVLNIGEVTVKYHMGQIMNRLHVKNREQAVTYALRLTSK